MMSLYFQGKNMKKIMLLLLMTTLLGVSCNKSDGSGGDSTVSTLPQAGNTQTSPSIIPNDPVEVVSPITMPPPLMSAVPEAALTFDTEISLVNFTSVQSEKYNHAIDIVKLVVATEDFRKQVLNHTFNGIKQFANSDGKTNAQIYASILDAAEKLRPIKNNTMDLEVELYYAATNVVGYTYSTTPRIWVNTKYFNSYGLNSVAGNLFHEWLHKLGYGHDSSVTAQRPYSVPYAIGYIIGNIGKKFL